MAVMMVRPESQLSRIFPPISKDLYESGGDHEGLTLDRASAMKLLALADVRLSVWQRLRLRRADPLKRFGWLLSMHRKAMDAEISARWKRADFYWSLFHRELRTISGNAGTWNALIRRLPVSPESSVLNDPVKLRERFIDEVVIDVHCAFFNGRLSQVAEPDSHDRAFRHFAAVRSFVHLSGLSDRDEFAMLAPASLFVIDLLMQDQNLKTALRICDEMNTRFPNVAQFQDKHAEIVFRQTIDGLTYDESPRASLRDWSVLSRGTDELDRLRKLYPNSISIYRFLAQLYQLRAVKLANGGILSEAIVDACKAMQFDPDLAEAEETYKSVVDSMLKLQERVEEIQAEIAGRENVVLNEQGRAMAEEASIGFSLLNKYHTSEEPALIKEGLAAARACSISQLPPLVEPQGNPYFLNATSVKPRRGEESMIDWLLSPRGKRLKVFASVAMALLVFSFALSSKDASARKARDAAYARILAAHESEDYAALVDNIEAFLSHPPVMYHKDRREDLVRSYYSMAMVRFIAQTDGELSDEAMDHLSRYSELSVDMQNGESE